MPDTKPADNTLIEHLKALAAKAPQGPYFVSHDDAEDCPDHTHSGLAMIDTGRGEDWPIVRLAEWNSAEFVVGLLNAWPALESALTAALAAKQSAYQSGFNDGAAIREQELVDARAAKEAAELRADDAHLSCIAAEEERELLRKSNVQNCLQIAALQEALMKAEAVERERDAYEAIINDDGSLNTHEEKLGVLEDMRLAFDHASMYEDAIRRCAAAERELAALRADIARHVEIASDALSAIAEHNAGCAESCAAQRVAGRCEGFTSRDRQCPDCPRDWMIEGGGSEALAALREANTDLAAESIRLRLKLSELVEAYDGCDDMDEMDGPTFIAAEKRLVAAVNDARNDTEQALLERAMAEPGAQGG